MTLISVLPTEHMQNKKIDTFNNVVIKDLVIFIQHMGAVVK